MTRGIWTFCLVALGVAVLLAVLSPLASTAPEAMEQLGKAHVAPAPDAGAKHGAPMPDYNIPGVRNESLRTILAGLAGMLIVFGLALGVGRLMCWRRGSTKAEGDDGATPASR